MKILLIGKTGQLGGSILELNKEHDILAPGREILDIQSPDSYDSVIKSFRPDVVINTAAFHNVPQCEIESETAFSINCKAMHELAITCKKNNIRLVTFSTDYVFSGEQRTPYDESSIPAPIQMYGITRLAGEHAVMSVDIENSMIIRTCGLYGLQGAVSKGGNFVDKRIQDAQHNSELEMGNDQTVTPTYTDDLAKAVMSLIEHPSKPFGIFHLVNEGECTWFEFTQAIYDFMEISTIVKPVDRGGLTGTMRRPLYSVLANKKAKELGIALPHWKEGLKKYIESKYK